MESKRTSFIIKMVELYCKNQKYSSLKDRKTLNILNCIKCLKSSLESLFTNEIQFINWCISLADY